QVTSEVQATFGLNYSPALADIMDAIARGDCLYGTAKLDFSAIYQDVCEKWVESARAEIRSKWAKYLPNFSRPKTLAIALGNRLVVQAFV
ncbi:MAG: hypothetical protein M3N42_14095, partial [Cyanobacteriota bacterium]|nr:hypothetical protein [Cyanobacteriota bacterium]